jgi:hypothetical protein
LALRQFDPYDLLMSSIRRTAARAVPVLAAAALVASAAGGQDGGAGTPSPPAEPAEEAKPGVVGGYSWQDKPRRKRRKKAVAPPLDPNKPLATYPGFAVQPDGTSKIWLSINKKVPVEVRRAAGRVVFVLRQVQVGVRNNTNPLVTTHFQTAVSSARLVREKDGAQLVVELREKVEPTHRVTGAAGGTMLLEITVPRPTRSFSDATPAAVAPRSAAKAPRGAGEKRTRGPRP